MCLQMLATSLNILLYTLVDSGILLSVMLKEDVEIASKKN